LARALDVVGDRWTLVIMQELLKRPSRYGELTRRLPGISTTVLAERLRRLEAAGVVERRTGPVGNGVVYAATGRGEGLDEVLAVLRQWGVEYLTDPTADGSDRHEFDVRYVDGIESLERAEFGLVVDDVPMTLHFDGGLLVQEPGAPAAPLLVVKTSRAFMRAWAAGTTDWDEGRRDGRVTVRGKRGAWPRFLAATGYLRRYEHADG
jgi:DNA-binding HxlR family transcriptional regulator